MGNKTLYQKEEKSAEVKKLKGHIRNLEHEIKRLKSELKTYDAAFMRSVTFLKDKTEELTVEELIEGAKNKQNVGEIKVEKKDKFEDLKQKWKCFECNEGILKLIIVPNNRYFRKCSCCEKRTEVKEIEGNLEGIK